MPKKGLTPFVDRLPLPQTIQPTKKTKKGTYYNVTMKEFTQKLHRDLPPTRLWGYNGMYPGPTFEVKKNEKVYVKWMNQLPTRHLLPVDKTIHGANMGVPTVRTVVHLHAGVTPSGSDGHSEAWFTRGFSKAGPKFKNKIYHYPNPQRASTLWYHDHALGITRLNVYAGLSGLYIIRDKEEESLNLPKGNYEVPLFIQDRSFNNDGSLYYPKQPTSDSPGPQPGPGPKPGPHPHSSKLPNPSIVPGFAGDTILVNGKVWPYLEVEPRKYRFRLVNGSNSRVYTFSLDSGQPFIQIGSDGGLLRSPVRVTKLTLAPAERADVIIDFSKQKGKSIILKNSAPIPFPEGDAVDAKTTALVLQFRVTKPLSSNDTSSIPQKLSNVPTYPRTVQRTRNVFFVETKDQYGREKLLLNNKAWHEPATEIAILGDVEKWNLINPTMHTHPIHMHLVEFKILSRRPFDVDHYTKTGKIRFTGPPKQPDPNERGLKDIVRCNPGEITSIITRFGPYTGDYMWHCHILEHEDYDMMRPLIVRSKGTKKREKK